MPLWEQFGVCLIKMVRLNDGAFKLLALVLIFR